MEQERENPFKPGWAKSPPFLAGREEAMRELEARVKRICTHDQGDGVLLVGPNGCGKTVLTLEMFRKARQHGAITRWLAPTLMREGETGVAHSLLHDDDPEGRATRKTAAGALKSGKEAGSGQPPACSLMCALRSLLVKKPVVLAIDQAQYMTPAFGRGLLQTAQILIVEGLPLLLVLSGTPGMTASLNKTGAGFWAMSPRFRVGRLESDDDIRQAFAVPARQSGLPLNEDALALLVRESQGYPYFIQMLGEFAWDAAAARKGATEIALRDAQAGLVRAAAAKGEFYQERYDEADDHGVLDAATTVAREMLARGANPVLRNRELAEILRNAASGTDETPRSLKEMLLNLGFIWRRHDGSWEPGVPSLCAYFVEQDEEQ